jgi:hypothetical protein
VFKNILYLIGFCMAQTAFAQVSVQATLSNNRIFIGDQTDILLDIVYPDGYEIEAIIPNPISMVGLEYLPIEQQDYWQTHTAVNGGTRYKTNITIQAFAPDTLDIPPLPILYSHAGKMDTAFSAPMALMIFPVMPDSVGKIQPIKEILTEPKTLEDYYIEIIIAILAFAALGIFYYFYLRRKKTINISNKTQGSPEQRALRKLQQLEQKKYLQIADYNTFCTELSYILRQFLEETYAIDALEMPTSDIVAFIDSHDFKYQANWKNILLTCDAVKFANAEASNHFYQNIIDDASLIIKEATYE